MLPAPVARPVKVLRPANDAPDNPLVLFVREMARRQARIDVRSSLQANAANDNGVLQ